MKVATVVGTRPEIIRLSRVMSKLDEYCEHTIIHTGQNYDYELNQIFFDDLGIRKPDYFLGAAGSTGAETIGTFVMGTVKGDVHDIGKNLVNIMLEGAGFEVIDLGVQTSPEKFIAAVEEHKPDIVGMSAFLTTTMPMFKVNMHELTKAGLRDKVIVMVGGAPVTQEYADAVGADGYAADASTAVRKAKELIALKRAAQNA